MRLVLNRDEVVAIVVAHLHANGFKVNPGTLRDETKGEYDSVEWNGFSIDLTETDLQNYANRPLLRAPDNLKDSGGAFG